MSIPLLSESEAQRLNKLISMGARNSLPQTVHMVNPAQGNATSAPPVEMKASAVQRSQTQAVEQHARTSPGMWVHQHQLRNELIQCYKKYPSETLSCSKMAKEFHDVVFAKHYETLLDRKGLRSKFEDDVNEIGAHLEEACML